MKGRIRWISLLAAFSLAALLGGCDSNKSKEAKDESKSAASKEAEEGDKSETPDEIVFAFQPQENPEALSPDADRLAEYMTEQIGIESKVFLPTSYAAVVEALRSKNADVAYFSGWPYLIAHREAGAELLVVEERHGNPFYWSQWHVKADSDIKTVADLKGKSVSFTSPTSTSGYLFPVAKAIEKGDMKTGQDPKGYFSNIIYAGGYQQSLMALAHGRVEAAAASGYAYEQYLTDEQKENIRVLSKQGPVPTHGVAVRGALPEKVKKEIERAFLKLNDSKHNKLLTSLYGAEKLVERTHEEHVAPLESALKLVGDKRDIEGFGAGSGSGHGSGSAHGSGKEGEGEHAKGGGAGSGSGSGSGAGSGAAHGHE